MRNLLKIWAKIIEKWWNKINANFINISSEIMNWMRFYNLYIKVKIFDEMFALWDKKSKEIENY